MYLFNPEVFVHCGVQPNEKTKIFTKPTPIQNKIEHEINNNTKQIFIQ